MMAGRRFRRAAPVAHSSGPPVNLALAAVGWWRAREGLRDWTMLDTNDGGLFVKGARTRVAQRAASTEIVHRRLSAADLTALVAEHAHATGAGARPRRGT